MSDGPARHGPPAGAAPPGRYVLRGRIVTMNGERDVIESGRLLVDGEEIRAVLTDGQPVPDDFRGCLEVDTAGTVYPGLIDLHNHYAYNALAMWTPKRRYGNRDQWKDHAPYETQVYFPVTEVLAKYQASARAVVRYVECKTLVGGTTTGQGIMARRGKETFALERSVRSVEAPRRGDLPVARTRVPNLNATSTKYVEEFKRALEDTEERGAAFFYHLSEGVDASSRQHFVNLQEHELLRRSLAAVHALALTAEDLSALADAGASVVWSPLSNLVLYGATHDVGPLAGSGVKIAIGSDWSPSGSKNLLEELKVASLVNERCGRPLSPHDLVSAVTSRAAEVAGWQERLGTLEPDKLADVLVLRGTTGDPYRRLIEATERDVSLVAVGGVARYGDRDLMRSLVGDGVEKWSLDGSAKGFYLHVDDSPLNDLTFAQAASLLRQATSDLRGFAKSQPQVGPKGEDGEDAAFSLVVDEFEDDPLTGYEVDRVEIQRANKEDMVNQVALDAPFVDADHLARLHAQPNLPEGFAAALAAFYRA